MRDYRNFTDIRGSMRTITTLLLLGIGIGTTAAQQVLNPVGHTVLTEQQNHYLRQQIDEPTAGAYEIVEVNPAAIKGANISLQIFGKSHYLKNMFVNERGHNDYSWFGQSDDGFGSVVLVVNGDMVTGQMTLDFASYSLMPLGEGLHVLIALDVSAFPHDEDDASYKELLKTAGAPKLDHVDYDNDPTEAAQPKAINNCSIRYLIAYTTAVGNALADVHGFIQSCIDNHNLINANSSSDHNVELARSVLVNYNEVGGNFSTDHARFKGTADGFMDNIHALRSLYDADVCQLIVNFGSSCGVTDVIGASYSSAFAVTERSCAVSNKTFTHETGHLYGARHDPYMDDATTPFAYGHGYVKISGNAATRWRTVMSYNNQCASLGADCERLPYWSNPNKFYFGNAMGTASVHNNALVTKNQEDVLAFFESRISNKSVTNNTVLSDEWGNIEGILTVTAPGGTNTSVVYNSGSRGNYRAGNEIILKTGFRAREGSNFVAYLGSCSNPLYLNSPDEDIVVENQEETSLSATGDLAAGTLDVALSQKAMDVKVFPNPFSDNTFIEVACENNDQVSINIHNMLGMMVLQPYKGIAPESGRMRIEAQMADLPSGIYIVNVIVNDIQSVHKIVKNK